MNRDDSGCGFGAGLTVFSHRDSAPLRRRKLLLFFSLCAVVAAQATYWVWANRVEPIVLGMTFGLFCIVSLIGVQFVLGLLMYRLDGASDAAREAGPDRG